MKGDEAFAEHVSCLAQFEGIIVVEGKKDSGALIDLGVSEENIYPLKKPLHAVVDEIVSLCEKGKCKRCMILTDLDSEGKRLYSVLQHKLKENGIVVENSFRNFLFRETNIRQIEGLKNHAPRWV